MNMRYDFSHKTAFVTGGTRGIGKAIAEKLLSYNATVVIAYSKSQADADALCRKAEAMGGKLYAKKCDISKPDAVRSVFDYIKKNFGQLDFLVNNAGITRDNIVLRMKEEQWLDVINTNLNGVYYCTQEALKLMLKKRYGRIINISSVVGIAGNAGQANYAASKAGIIGFSKSVAKEMGSRNILVNVVAPGYIETDMISGIPEDAKSHLLSTIPHGRYGTPNDVANVICFLLSEDAGYINGAVINVNGGMY